MPEGCPGSSALFPRGCTSSVRIMARRARRRAKMADHTQTPTFGAVSERRGYKRIPFRERLPQPSIKYQSAVGRWRSPGVAVGLKPAGRSQHILAEGDLGQPALTTFRLSATSRALAAAGLDVVKSGNSSAPKESVHYGHIPYLLRSDRAHHADVS